MAAGRRHRVFCASMADVFDNRAPLAWRADLWQLIRATPAVDLSVWLPESTWLTSPGFGQVSSSANIAAAAVAAT